MNSFHARAEVSQGYPGREIEAGGEGKIDHIKERYEPSRSRIIADFRQEPSEVAYAIAGM